MRERETESVFWDLPFWRNTNMYKYCIAWILASLNYLKSQPESHFLQSPSQLPLMLVPSLWDYLQFSSYLFNLHLVLYPVCIFSLPSDCECAVEKHLIVAAWFDSTWSPSLGGWFAQPLPSCILVWPAEFCIAFGRW